MVRFALTAVLLVLLCATPVYAGNGTIRGPNKSEVADRLDVCAGMDVPGGGYNSDTGRYSWTCAYYNWHGMQDSSQTTASYFVDCTGDGTPHTACVNADERLLVGGAVHRAALAVYYTEPGGTIYFRHTDDQGRDFLVVDDGCGQLEGGGQAACPDPYDPDIEALTHFSESGYHHEVRLLRCGWEGRKCVGEGTPRVIKTHIDDDTPERSGSMILVDRGNAFSATDGPGQDQYVINHTIGVGYANTLDAQQCYNNTLTDASCDHLAAGAGIVGTTSEQVYATRHISRWGARSSVLVDVDGASFPPAVCLDNRITTQQATTTGTCSGDRRYRAWDATADGTDDGRDDGGCEWDLDGGGIGGPGDLDLGPAQGFVDALEAEMVTTPEEDYALLIEYPRCKEGAASSSDCPAGSTAEAIVAIHEITATSCDSGNGRLVELGTTITHPNIINGRSWPFEQEHIFYGAGVNRVYAVKMEEADHRDGGIYNLGVMPANWLYRDSATAAADCLSGGDSDTTDDEAECDTTSLLNGQIGFEGVIDNSLCAYGSTDGRSNCDGVGIALTWSNNLFSNHRRGPWNDVGNEHRFYGNTWLRNVTTSTGFNFFGSFSKLIGNRFEDNVASPYIASGGAAYTRDNAVDDVIISGSGVPGGTAVYVQGGRNFALRHSTIRTHGLRRPIDLQANLNIDGVTIDDVEIYGRTSTGSAAVNLRCGDETNETIQHVTVNKLSYFPYDDTTGSAIMRVIADTASCDVEESVGTHSITNSHIRSDDVQAGIFGAYEITEGCDVAGGACFPWTFDDTGVVALPRMVGNLVNGTSVPDFPHGTVAAADAGDCDNLPQGTTIGIYDDTNTGACTDADANGILDGGGSSVSTATCDGAGTWGC